MTKGVQAQRIEELQTEIRVSALSLESESDCTISESQKNNINNHNFVLSKQHTRG